MSKWIRVKESRVVNYFKPLSVEKYREIENAEQDDQSYALSRYRKLVQIRREKEKLRPREPEIYHHDICRKS